MDVCEQVGWRSAFPLEPSRASESSVAVAGMGWGSWGVKGGNCGVRGEQPKHGPHQLRGDSPEESAEPLPGAASDLLGLGNIKGTALDGEVLVAGRGSVVCEPSGPAGASMSRCHVQRKQHSFPCGWLERQQEPCWESSEKPEGFFSAEGKDQTQFATWVLLSQGRSTVRGKGDRWCCGPSVPLKKHFSCVCGVSKGWLRKAARAEVFPEVLPLDRAPSVL